MRVLRLILDALVWRHLKRDVVRALITLLGVALGVSVVVAIRLANTSVLSSFQDSVDRIAGRANLQIRGDGFPFDEALLERLDWLFPLAEVSPAVTGTFVFRDRPNEVIEVLGVDLFRDQRTRDYRLLQAPGEEGEGLVRHLLEILTGRNSILLTEKLAARVGLQPGDEVEVLADDRAVRLKVVDLIAGDGLANAMAGDLALMDIAAAQWLFRKFGQIDRIDLVVRDPGRVPEVQARLRREVPAFVLVEPPSGRTRQVEGMVSAYQLNLTALSWIALFVGIFLVYNTVSIAVIRRRREIGISRALGAPRSAIALAFAIEALLLGLVGSALGIALGRVFAAGSVGAAVKTAASFYERVVVDRPSLDGLTVLLALATGVGLSLFAGFLPVREAMKVPPAEATRTGSWEGRRRQNAVPCAVAGLALLALAGLAGVQPPVSGRPLFGFLSGFLIVLGFSLLAPVCIRALQVTSRELMARLFGPAGRIATANLASSLGRTSITVAALMIGLAMTIGMGIMIGSFRTTIDTWVDRTAKCDLWIKAGSSYRVEGRISAETIRKIADVPGVEEVDPYREVHTTFRDRSVILGSTSFEIALRRSELPIKEGGALREVFREQEQGETCIVSESFSLRHATSVGDTISVKTPAGKLPLRISGVYYEYSNDRGYIIIDRDTFIERFGDESANVVAVHLEPGAGIAETRERILKEVGRENPLVVRTMAMLKAEVLRIFDRTFAVTRALQAIAIVVAVLGILNTQIALVLERRREIALLRYLGATTRQIRQIVVLESGLLGLVGVGLGIAAGTALSVVLIFVINKQSFGWTIQAHFPTGYVLSTSLVVLAAAVLAGFYPSHLAARVNAQEALRAE